MKTFHSISPIEQSPQSNVVWTAATGISRPTMYLVESPNFMEPADPSGVFSAQGGGTTPKWLAVTRWLPQGTEANHKTLEGCRMSILLWWRKEVSEVTLPNYSKVMPPELFWSKSCSTDMRKARTWWRKKNPRALAQMTSLTHFPLMPLVIVVMP